MTNEQAVAQLEALVDVPGSLRVITNEVRPDLREDPDAAGSPIRADVLESDPHTLKRPSTFVIHDVVRLEGPDARGRMIAHTAEGDWTLGYPVDLLARLLEAGQEHAVDAG